MNSENYLLNINSQSDTMYNSAKENKKAKHSTNISVWIWKGALCHIGISLSYIFSSPMDMRHDSCLFYDI